MDQLQQITAQASRHKQEAALLYQQIQHLEKTQGLIHNDVIDLTLSQSKRVAREGRLLTQELAILRDNLQPGGTR